MPGCSKPKTQKDNRDVCGSTQTTSMPQGRTEAVTPPVHSPDAALPCIPPGIPGPPASCTVSPAPVTSLPTMLRGGSQRGLLSSTKRGAGLLPSKCQQTLQRWDHQQASLALSWPEFRKETLSGFCPVLDVRSAGLEALGDLQHTLELLTLFITDGKRSHLQCSARFPEERM